MECKCVYGHAEGEGDSHGYCPDCWPEVKKRYDAELKAFKQKKEE